MAAPHTPTAGKGVREILGDSALLKKMLGMIEKVAGTKTNILVIGESGTGKELVARLIHDSGPLAGKPFVPVNCGAIPENLIESEMFGHKKGSFTGAVSDKMGLFEAANGGTLFLDEVGELPLGMQVKLLRAIQERIFKKVGGTDDVRVDLRIIAATNRNLEQAVARGTFREDLYYRLNVITITTPPLRDRPGDIEILAKAFLTKFAAKMGRAVQDITPEAMAILKAYAWPGNVRELENTMERAVALETENRLHPEHLSDAVRAGTAAPGRAALDETLTFEAKFPVSLPRFLQEVELRLLRAALSSGPRAAAARLGISEDDLARRCRERGVPLS